MYKIVTHVLIRFYFMYNIYQSSRRKDIQYTVYAKSSKIIRLFDTDYIATIKEKKI